MNGKDFEKKLNHALSLCTDEQWQRLQDGFYDENALMCKEALEELGVEREFDEFVQHERQKPKPTPNWLEKVRAAEAEAAERDKQREAERCRSISRMMQQTGQRGSDDGYVGY